MSSDQECRDSQECLELLVEQHCNPCEGSGIDNGNVMMSVTGESVDPSSTYQGKIFSTIQATLSADLVELIAKRDQQTKLYETVKACFMEPMHLVASGTMIVVGFRTSDLCRLECKLLELVSDKQTISCNGRMTSCSELDVKSGNEKQIGVASVGSLGTKLSKSPSKNSKRARQQRVDKISAITGDNKHTTSRNDSMKNIKSIVKKCNNLSTTKCCYITTMQKRGRQRKPPMSLLDTPSDVQLNSDGGDCSTGCTDHEYAAPVDKHVVSSESADEQEQANGSADSSSDADDALVPDSSEHCTWSETGKNKLQLTSHSHRKQLTKSQTYESRMPYSFFCTECSFRAKRKGHLHRHLLLHDRGLPVLKCSKCSYSTLSPTHLSRHLTNVHSSTVFGCSVDGCTYNANSSQRLHRHISLRHSDKEADRPLLPCPIPGCNYQALSEKRLERHATAKHRKIKEDVDDDDGLVIPLVARFRCSKCDYETNHRSHFLRHLSSLHGNVCPFLCDTCGQRFKRKDGLVAHSLLHTTSDRDSFKFCCKICGRKFRSKSNLTNHQAFHSTARPHICELCGVSFKSQAERRKHVKTIHDRPHSFNCKICGVSVSTLFALQRHATALHGIKRETALPCPGTQAMEISVAEKTLGLEELLRNQSSD